MRKIFYTVFSISQICFLLLYPQEALAASKEGMQLCLFIPLLKGLSSLPVHAATPFVK